MARAAQNVISAKAHAMYGRALKPQQFNALLGCHSISEIASILKNDTPYQTALAGINEATVHRGHLEILLRRKLWDDFAGLVRYDSLIGKNRSGANFSAYLIAREEVEQIVLCARLLYAGRAEEYMTAVPAFFVSHTKLDFVKMSRARSLPELAEALLNTRYHALLAPLLDEKDASVTMIEKVLYDDLIQKLLLIVGDTKGQQKKQLTALCGAQIDSLNVNRIVRLKSFFGAGNETVRKSLTPSGGSISPRILRQMTEAADAKEVMELFWQTGIGRKIPEAKRVYTFDLQERVPYYSAKYYFYFSLYPTVVMMSYILLMETEMTDIVNILEGVRYGMSPDEIKSMLITNF